MAVFTAEEVRARAQKARVQDQLLRKSISTRGSAEILLDSVRASVATKTYDIFLSHSVHDAELVLGVKAMIEDLGYSTYVDWIEDPSLDRSKVTPATADTLRRRMRTSKSLFYITTENADASRWMPWECGYFDGLRHKVAIVPVKGYQTYSFQGVEYLGLYPYCIHGPDRNQKERLWIHKDQNTYLNYDSWVASTEPDVAWRTGG